MAAFEVTERQIVLAQKTGFYFVGFGFALTDVELASLPLPTEGHCFEKRIPPYVFDDGSSALRFFDFEICFELDRDPAMWTYGRQLETALGATVLGTEIYEITDISQMHGFMRAKSLPLAS